MFIVKLNQVTVDEVQEGGNDSLPFQRLQTMLLEQFGENCFSFIGFGNQSIIKNSLLSMKLLI